MRTHFHHQVARRALTIAGVVLPIIALGTEAAAAAPTTIRVRTTIQEAVDRASPGDTVLVPSGTYRESVRVSTPGITIAGAPTAVLDGGNSLPTGIIVRPTDRSARLAGFTLNGLTVQNFTDVGVLTADVDNVRLTNSNYRGNDQYGPFPIRSTGRVDHNVVSGSNDSGIYVGQSNSVLIDHNLTRDNTIGIEVELATRIRVEDNVAVGNTSGLVIQVVPGLTATATRDVTVRGNSITANNRPNPVTDPEELLSLVPSGTGVLSIGADDVQITSNIITANRTLGVGVISLPPEVAAGDPRLEPSPDRTVVVDNVIAGNGRAPDSTRPSPLAGFDIGWDGTGTGNCFAPGRVARTIPSALPRCAGGPS